METVCDINSVARPKKYLSLSLVLSQTERTVRFGCGLVTNLLNPVWFGQKYAAKLLL